MSAARQNMRVLRVLWVCASVVLGAFAAAAAAVLGPVVTNPQTGLAIDGFDPVSYFTGGAPREGRADLEYRLDTVTWRFNNEGNRAAFIDHPEVYAPQFGGYDPVAIGRGVSVAGNPLTFAVVGERLYFFYDAKARADFVEAPRRTIEAAQRRWPDVSRTLP
jgi:hypothetical protein